MSQSPELEHLHSIHPFTGSKVHSASQGSSGSEEHVGGAYITRCVVPKSKGTYEYWPLGGIFNEFPEGGY